VGCPGETPTVSEVIRNIDEEHFEAYVVNRIPEADSLDITSRTDNTFVFNLDSSVPATNIQADIRVEIADFIGNGVTEADVTLEIDANKKRQGTYSSTITATVDETDDDDDDDGFPDSAVVFSGLGSLLVTLFLAMF